MAKWRQKSSWPMRARRLADLGSRTTPPHVVLLTEGCSVPRRHSQCTDMTAGLRSRRVLLTHQVGREAGALLAWITEGAGCPAVPVTGWSPHTFLCILSGMGSVPGPRVVFKLQVVAVILGSWGQYTGL